MTPSRRRAAPAFQPAESLSKDNDRRRFPVEILFILGFLAVWILLQLVILPRLGVPT